MPGDLLGHDLAEVAHSGAAVQVRVRVDQLVPAARARETDAVVLVRDRGEVDDAGQRVTVRREPQERERVVLRVLAGDPPEAAR